MPQLIQTSENLGEIDRLLNEFMAIHGTKFPDKERRAILSRLSNVNKYTIDMVQHLPYKNPKTTQILSIFNLDLFYLGEYWRGFLKFITLGILIAWLIGMFTAKSRTRKYNYRLFEESMKNQ